MRVIYRTFVTVEPVDIRVLQRIGNRLGRRDFQAAIDKSPVSVGTVVFWLRTKGEHAVLLPQERPRQ